MRRHRLPLWTTCDVFAPGIALGHVVGRVGCLMAGCCWGRQTTLPWGDHLHRPVRRTRNVGTPLGVPLHPTQLYEAGAELLILGLLLATERKGRPFPGRTFWGYMLLYAVSRFAIEFFRGDPRGAVLGVSTSQFISLVLVPLSLVMLVVLGRAAPADAPRRPKAPAPDRPERRDHGRSSFTVPAEEAGHRLDRFLVGVMPGQSRSQLQRLIKDGHVRVAGTAVRPNTPSAPGSVVAVDDARPVPAATASRKTCPLEILYEDSRPRRRQQAGRHGRAPGGGPRAAARW